MADTQIAITRSQLNAFISDPRTIRVFEQIANMTGTVLPDSIAILNRLVEEVSTETSSTTAQVNSLLSVLSTISSQLDMMTTAQRVVVEPLIKLDALDFAVTAPDYAVSPGRLHWDGFNTLHLDMSATLDQSIGYDTMVYYKASAAVTKGQLLYTTGTVGASGVYTCAPTATGLTIDTRIIGIAAESVALNGFGSLKLFGIIRNINTTGTPVGEVWADFDKLYYNPAIVGALTNVEPVAPNLKMRIATVINASAGAGSLQVGIVPGLTLGNQSNVSISAVADNDSLQYDSANTRWRNVARVTAAGVTATETIIPHTTKGIVGTTTNNSAQAGSVGEFPSPTNLTAVALTTSTATNASSISLTAGDYEVSGMVRFLQAATTTGTTLAVGISTTSATFGAVGTYTQITTAFPVASDNTAPSPVTRISLAATTTVYLIAYMTFAVSTCAASGFLHVRRVR